MDEAPARFRVRMFGGFLAEVDGVPLRWKHSRKEHWLLALLVLSNGKEVARATLAQTLWPFPDHSTDQALNYLRRALWQLTMALGKQAYRIQRPTPRTLRLDLADSDVDLLDFSRRATSSDFEDWMAALDVYGGPFLTDCTEDWAIQEREKREYDYRRLLIRSSQKATENGDHPRAITCLRRAAALEPYSEELRRSLMEALAASGDLSGALDVYQDLARLLQRERGEAPDPATAALRTRIRATLRNSGAGGNTPAVDAAAGTRDAPARGRSGWLPSRLTALRGRKEDTRQVRELLDTNRLVTLAGSGGVGKTSLAIAVAHEVQARFPEGAWFVDLSLVQSSGFVAETVAITLDLRHEPNRSARQLLLDHLRDRDQLIILDGCEHLHHACARLTAELLSACPGLRLLTTSRQALGITGERVWRVPSLNVPDPECLPADQESLSAIVHESPSMMLFLDRARDQDPAFTIATHNARCVARICARLDGIPLAIELAAARLKSLTVEQIDQLLDDRFRLLIGGNPAGLERHQTLRALIDWSCQLLSEQEQAVMEALATFRGSWGLEAAESVAGGELAEHDDFLSLLTGLIDKSLIMKETAGGGAARYRMLETIREYFGQRLIASGRGDQVCRRHRDWCHDYVRNACLRLRGSDQLEWFAALNREHANVQAALKWSVEKDSDPDAALDMAGRLWHYWTIRGYAASGRQWLRVLLRGGGEPANRARGLLALSVLTDRDGVSGHATELAEAGLRWAVEANDAELMAYGNLALSWIRSRQGCSSASGFLKAALEASRGLDDPWLMAALGVHTATLGAQEPDVVRKTFPQTLRLCENAGDRWLISEITYLRAMAALQEQDFPAARTWLGRTENIAEQIGDERGRCAAWLLMGSAATREGQFDEAEKHFRDAIALAGTLRYVRGLTAAQEAMARLAKARNNLPDAARWLGAHACSLDGASPPLPLGWPSPIDLVARDVEAALGSDVFSRWWEEGFHQSPA